MNANMHIDFEVKNDLCILRLKGRFMTGSNAEFKNAKAELQRTGCRRVIADLREVPFLDSTGIAFVVSLYTTLTNSGGHFVLASLNHRIREVLKITTLDEIIPIFDDVDAARAALADTKVALRELGLNSDVETS